MRKRHTDPGVQGVALGMIITPMLDMAFQILAFFIMTYHPSALEGHIPGSLVPPDDPAIKSDKKIDTDTPPPSIDESMLLPELAEAVTVKVKSITTQPVGNRTDGQPGQMFIKRKADTAAKVVAEAEGESIEQSLKRLESALREIQKEAGAEKGNTHAKIEADAELRQMYVMQVYDACKKAGFSKIHFVPPPLTPRK